jgi:hypothetical protein
MGKICVHLIDNFIRKGEIFALFIKQYCIIKVIIYIE